VKAAASTPAREVQPDVASAPMLRPGARRSEPAAPGSCHFAKVPTTAAGQSDGEALEALLTHMAGQLGIRAGTIEIRTGAEAEVLTMRRDAAGVAHNGVIHIPRSRLEIRSPQGRRLLAHEAAHAAQMRLPVPARPTLRARALAEVEAETFARRYTASRAADPVRVALPPQTLAANVDFDSLLTLAKANHPEEIAAITDLMSYGAFDWLVSDQDVFDALGILATYTLPVARAIARGLEPKYRQRLYDNLNPPHFAAHRPEILATCWAAENEQEFSVVNYDILSRMKLQDLDPLEAIALDKVATLSPKMVTKAVAADGRKSKQIRDAQEYVASGEALSDADKTITEGIEGELKLSADHATAAARRAELDKTDPQGAAFAKGIADRIDADDLDAVTATGILTDVQKALPRVLNQQPAVEALALRIGVPRISKLLDQIPARTLYGDKALRDTFIQLAAVRPPYQNAKLAEDLTTSPWWKVWDDVSIDEAYTAYLLVRALPPRGRAAFLRSRAGAKWSEILAVLPASIREDPSFNFYDGGKNGGKLQTDRQGLLIALTDDALWSDAAKTPDPPESAPPGKSAPPQYNPIDRLDAFLRLAEAAGEGSFVFDQSKRVRADLKPRLKALVGTHRLYVKNVRETYEPPVLPTDKAVGLHWARLAFGVLGSLSIDYAKGSVGFDADISRLDEVAGARFRRTTDEEKDNAEAQGTLARNIVHADVGKDWLSADAPNIVVEALATVGETAIHAGPITCKGLHVDMKYVPGWNRFKIEQLKSMDVSFKEVTIDNCSIALSDAIYVVKRLRLTGGRIGITNQSLQENVESVWLWKMFEVILNPGLAKNASLAFDLLALRSVATSGGFYVDSIEINGFAIQAGGDAAAYLDALNRSAARLDKRVKQEEADVVADADHAQQHRDEAAALGKQLLKVQAEIARGEPHGSVVDIRSIRISGVPGISEKPLEFDDIHGQGRSVAAIVPIFADPTSIRNMIRGEGAGPTIRGRDAKTEQFSLDITRIQSKDPIRIAAAIPTAAKAKEDYEEFQKAKSGKRYDAHYEAVRKALDDRASQARAYEDLAARGVQNLSTDEKSDELKTFRNLRAALLEFEARRATIIESLTLEGVHLNINGDGNPELVAEVLKTGAIRTFGQDGAETFSVGKAEGRNVAIGAALQGGLANYKEWRKAMRSGTLKADQLTLKDIRYAGLDASIEELSFDSQGGIEGLDIGFDRGDKAAGGAGVTVRSGKVIAKGVNAPTQAALIRAEKARIDALSEADRSKEEQKRLLTIEQMLRDYDRITLAKSEAEEAVAKAKTKPQRATAAKGLEKAEQALKNWQDRLVIEKLTIDQLNLAISGLGDVLAEGYAFDKDAKALKVKGGTAGQPWFQKVQAEGVRRRGAKGDQMVAERITIGPVDGEVEKTKKGYAFNGLTIASIAAKGVSWQSGKATIQSIGESRLEGISIDATYEKDGGTAKFSVTEARIKQIVADQLRYENESAVVTVKSGSLVGIAITNLNVTLPEEGDAVVEAGGQVAVQKVQALAIDAVVGGKKVVGQVDSKTPTADANAIKVDFAKAGERSLSLLGLEGNAQVTDLKTGGRLHVALKRLSGKITQKNENDFAVRDLSIPDVTITGIHWIAGEYTIDVADRVTLAGIMLDADASLRPKALKKGELPKLDDDGKPIVEKELGKLLVHKFTVSEIAARAVKITSPRIETKAGSKEKVKPEKTIELKEAVIKGLKITGFDVLNRAGKVEVTDSVKVTDLRATIGAEATKDLKKGTASFTIYGKDAKEPGAKARELSADIRGKDGTTLKLGRTQDLVISDIDLLSEVEGKPGQTTRTKVDKVSVPGISVGSLFAKDDLVTISDLEVDAPIAIDGVLWKASLGGKAVGMVNATLTQGLVIKTIEAKFKQVPVRDPKPGEDKTTTDIDRVRVKGLGIPQIVAKGLYYEGPSDDKDMTERVKVELPDALVEGIVLEELTQDFTAKTLKLKGGIRKVTAPHFAVTLSSSIADEKDAKRFGGDLTADTLTADAVLKTTGSGASEKTTIASGGFKITSVGLKRLFGYTPTPSDPKKTPWSFGTSGKYPTKGADGEDEGFNAELKGVGYDAKGASVESATAHSFRFSDPDHGVTLDIQDLNVPKGFTVPNEGPITLPEATITDAALKIADLSALVGGKSGGDDDEEGFLKKEQRDDLLDKINGTVKGHAFVPLYLFNAATYDWYIRQDVFELDLEFTNGRLNYEKAWKTAAWLRYRAIASLQMDYDYEVGISGDPVAGPSYLTLQVGSFNQKSWTPGDQKEREEMEAGSVRLKRLIAPDGSNKKKEKKYDEKGKEIKDRPMVNPDEIELLDVDAKLSIDGGTVLDLKEYGQITLGAPGRKALSDLTVKSTNKSSAKFAIGSLAVQVNQLNIGGKTIKGADGKPAQILIDGVADGQVNFHNGKVAKPGALQGTVTSATIRNLALDRGKK